MGRAVLVELKLGDATLQRLMLTLTEVPFTFSRVMRSTWMTHFRRYTCTILPSRPLWVPRHHLHLFVLAHRDRPRVVLVTPSAERGALISTRRTLEGAVKCSFRHFHREPDTRGLYFIVAGGCGERRRPFLRIVWDYLLWLRVRGSWLSISAQARSTFTSPSS